VITRTSLDAFALTNPALCSLVLHSFANGYAEQASSGMELALAYLPLPFTMTSSLAATFQGTNAATGFLKWLTRSPELRLDVVDAFDETTRLTRRGLIFGLQRRILTLESGRLRADADQLLRVPREPAGADISRRPYTIARRLGGWCGSIGSAKTVFTLLGIA
jgi:hypothetical protein